jgi:hypothetical protein
VLEANAYMATREQKTAADLGEQAIALAEQLGRIAGTIEGTAESWLKRERLAKQLTRVRDGATQMLEGLQQTPAPAKGTKKTKSAKATAAAPAQANPAHAPGKKRRGPAPTMHGVKKSDETIPKARLAEANRQRRKNYA